jgi:hypothetical protein
MDSVNTDVTVAKGKLVSFNLMQYYIKIIKREIFFFLCTAQSDSIRDFFHS